MQLYKLMINIRTILIISKLQKTPLQVLQNQAKEFLAKMNSKLLAPQLNALELVPETVESDIRQSRSKEEANAHLLSHLKEDADEETVKEVFRIVSEKAGYIWEDE